MSVVHCRRWRRRLCIPLPATGLNTETPYLVQICTLSEIYGHQSFSLFSRQ